MFPVCFQSWHLGTGQSAGVLFPKEGNLFHSQLSSVLSCLQLCRVETTSFQFTRFGYSSPSFLFSSLLLPLLPSHLLFHPLFISIIFIEQSLKVRFWNLILIPTVKCSYDPSSKKLLFSTNGRQPQKTPNGHDAETEGEPSPNSYIYIKAPASMACWRSRANNKRQNTRQSAVKQPLLEPVP